MTDYAIDVGPEFIDEAFDIAKEINLWCDMSIEELQRCVRDIGDHIDFLVNISGRSNVEEDIDSRT